MTVVRHESGTGTVVCGLIIAVLGGWVGCCLIPCCVDDCMDAVHECPNCHALVGRKRFMFSDWCYRILFDENNFIFN